MKKNKMERQSGGHGALLIVAFVLIAAAAGAAAFAYTTLRDVCREQCVIDDVSMQVDIHDGKLVKGDVVADALGLRNGANLAEIDFSKRRADVLARYPAIRDLVITRHLPDRVEISIEERKPVVRMNIRGHKGDTGRVADTDGVVFQCRRGTGLLPIIREEQAPGTAVGKALKGRALGALRLVEACREPELQELAVLEVDVSKPDYLTVTMGRDYSTLKIAWNGMENPTEATRKDLVQRLTKLRDAIRSEMGIGAKVWNARDLENPNYVYADTKEIIR